MTLPMSIDKLIWLLSSCDLRWSVRVTRLVSDRSEENLVPEIEVQRGLHRSRFVGSSGFYPGNCRSKVKRTSSVLRYCRAAGGGDSAFS